MAGSSILLTAGTKQHCHSCNSSKKEKRFFQIFYSCAGNWGWKFTEKSIELSTKAELLSFSYRSNLPSYSVIHKLTLNSWVFLKTSYLPVPQDSSLAGKLEISNFKFLRWSDCFLRFVRLWHCRKNNRGRERFLIRYPFEKYIWLVVLSAALRLFYHAVPGQSSSWRLYLLAN